QGGAMADDEPISLYICASRGHSGDCSYHRGPPHAAAWHLRACGEFPFARGHVERHRRPASYRHRVHVRFHAAWRDHALHRLCRDAVGLASSRHPREGNARCRNKSSRSLAYGQANCSPERPKQNFLPTLTSCTRRLTPDVGWAGSRSCSSPMPTASSTAGFTPNGSIKASRIASARRWLKPTLYWRPPTESVCPITRKP